MLIINGTIVTADTLGQADILIQKGTIAGIWSHPKATWLGAPGMYAVYRDLINAVGPSVPAYAGQRPRVVDATGCFVFAGGIDPHVHLHLPTSNGYSSDDFSSGSRAALFGGTTTLIDFVTPKKGQLLMEALEKRKAEAADSLIDYSFHVSPIEWRDSLPDEINECVQQGITSFKVYMAYKDSVGIDDAVMKNVMKAVAEAGGLLTVHAELGDEVEGLRNRLFAEGQTGPAAHPLSRPPEMEGLAVKNIIELSELTNCPIYIVHVSTKKAVDRIREARKRGLEVYAEVCPHHLLLDDSSYNGDFLAAAPYVISPPLRKPQDQEALWEALADGTIQVVGTDHCPFMMKQKTHGRYDFRKIANGAGGIEHRLELLYTCGVLNKRISMNRFVDVIAAQPAKRFGLYPLKGLLVTGYDADLVVWNPEVEKTISAREHHQRCDHNIYEGMGVKGRAEYVVVKGVLAINKGELVKKATGRFLKRGV